MRSDKTCGPLFQDCLTHFTNNLSQDPVLLFAAGMACGQAEKIYLGACSAAMFRPSTQHKAKMLSVCVFLSAVYGLEVSVFEREEIADEIWIHSPDSRGLLAELRHEEVNSPQWHILRGLLCGIRLDDIDVYFHTRKGYEEPCDLSGDSAQ